jgi:hypothetical protein
MTTTQSVKGTIYNAATNQPLEGAIVMIADGNYEHPDIAAQSDQQGAFYLPEVQVPGNYTLLVNYNGQSKKIPVHLSKENQVSIPW